MSEQDWARIIAALFVSAAFTWWAWRWVSNPPPAPWLRHHRHRGRRS